MDITRIAERKQLSNDDAKGILEETSLEDIHLRRRILFKTNAQHSYTTTRLP